MIGFGFQKKLTVMILMGILIHILWATLLFGQHNMAAVNFEMRDLGVPYMNAIPSDECAITSLVLGPDGRIYGGTTGDMCHLFVFSPNMNQVDPMGQFDGHQSIHHALAVGKDGMIYIGTGLNEIQEHPISDPEPGRDGITNSIWKDTQERYRQYPGGCLYRYDPTQENRSWTDIGQPAQVEKLGIPVSNNGIYTLTASPVLPEIYGITYPDGHFFVYTVEQGHFFDKGPVYEKSVFGGPNRSLRSICRALICDDRGHVYGTSDDQNLFRYDCNAEKIIKIGVQIPYIDIAVVEAFVKSQDGIIYGGTSEGFLFRFDPQTETVTNLGKPIDQMRIRALTFGMDDKLYGIAGERTNRCRFFSYDPDTGGYLDFGFIYVDRTPYYKWRAIQFDAMVTGVNGIIYLGESERRSHLFLFYPLY